MNGVGIKDFPNKTVFSGNKIPTFVGHEGTKRDEKRNFIMKKQSPQVFCVDENSFTGSGYTYIVDDGNTIQGYVTYNTINQKEKRCQDCTIYRTREVGDKVQDEWQRMVPCWTRTASSDDMLKYINSYIDIGGDDCGVAETIMALKNREKTDVNGAETYLKKCERYFAFLDKDRRSQQVFQTYRILAEGQQGVDFTSNTLNTKPTMVSLQDIGSINCGVSCC